MTVTVWPKSVCKCLWSYKERVWGNNIFSWFHFSWFHFVFVCRFVLKLWKYFYPTTYLHLRVNYLPLKHEPRWRNSYLSCGEATLDTAMVRRRSSWTKFVGKVWTFQGNFNILILLVFDWFLFLLFQDLKVLGSRIFRNLKQRKKS